MTPVSSVANTVTSTPPPAPAGDAGSGEGQEAFIDALLALIADIAGVPEAMEAAPAAGSESEHSIPPEEVAGTEATDERPEIDWAEVVLVPAGPAATPDTDAPASGIVETAPASPAEGVPDTGPFAAPPTAASPAPDPPPASRTEPSADSRDVAAAAAATATDNPEPRFGQSTDARDAEASTTAAHTDSPAHRRAEGPRDDREPVDRVTTSARAAHGAPATVEAETIAAIRAEPSIPASDKRGMMPPAPVVTGRIADAPRPPAAQGKTEGDAATSGPDDGAPAGKVSVAGFADPGADTDPATPSARDAHDTATPAHAASLPAIATHDATAAAAAQSGVTRAATGPTSHAPNTVVTVPVTAEQLAEVVSQEVVRATPKGEHRLEITLHPPELGRIEVNMVVGRDSVQAHLVAHTEGARDLLTHHLTDLREQLVAQGFADPRLSVDLRHGSGGRGGYRADRRSDSTPREDREVAPAHGPARMPEPRDRHALHLIA